MLSHEGYSMTKKVKCRECGGPVEQTSVRERVFCQTKCRDKWNNRRRIRGAELYDLFMHMRYSRGIARVHGMWALACRMASHWRAEDERLGVSQSYSDAKPMLERLQPYKAKVVG